MPIDATVRVRMYRQGLGDCFLVSLLREGARPFHLMIDCGVILGTPAAAERLRKVVAAIVAETGGYVDVLAVTHEHYDHVAGFLLARDLFAGPEDPTEGRLSVGEVWLAWTEDPANALAQSLRRERAAQLGALTAMALRLGATEDDASPLVSAMSFFGVSPNGAGIGDTAQAIRNAAGLVPPDRVRYLRPGAVLAPEAAPELRFRVLGPPMDRASLRRTGSTREVYRVAPEALEASVLLAAGEGRAPAEAAASPFGPGWGLPLAGLAEEKDDRRAAFFQRHYYGGPGEDLSWRRIDGDWLTSADGLALALDGATNNTSLVLAIEVVASGAVLLFAADAQVGNWLSWQNLTWPEEGGAVGADDLLGRTVFYKVGHHGSHNATLKARGLERMPARGLVSFIPVDEAMAKRKGWNAMPLPALLAALAERCGPDVIRLDQDPPNVPGVSTGGEGVQYGSLWVDWTLPVARPPSA